MSSRTLSVVALILAVAGAAHVRIDNDPLVATALAGFVLLVLPGLLTLGLTPGLRIALPQRLAFAFAASWCVIATLCVISFKLEWSLSRALLLLFAFEAALATVLIVRPTLPQDRIDRPQLVVLAAVMLISILAYRTGGYTSADLGPAIAPGWSTMEEGLQISTVRKIADADHLRPSQSMYARGEIPTYIYPVYPFALAGVSRISGLDPLIVFDTFRLWSAGLAMLALYTFTVVAFGRSTGAIATLAICALILLGHAGPGPDLGSWGQLIPLTHIGDFSLGVLFPLGLALVAHTVDTGVGGGVVSAIALPFLMAMALTHLRESAHVLSYMVTGLVVGLAVRGFDRTRAIRLGALSAVLIVVTVLLSRHIQAEVPFIAAHELASAAKSKIDMMAELRDGMRLNAGDVPMTVQPWVGYAVVIAPIALLLLRFSSGAVMLLAGLLAWWLPLNVPLLARFLERIVYSEIMMSPVRYVFQASYLVFGLTVSAAALLIDEAFRLLPTARRKVVLEIDGKSIVLTRYLRYRVHLLVAGAVIIALMLLSLVTMARMLAVSLGQPAGALALIGAVFVAYQFRHLREWSARVHAYLTRRPDHPGFLAVVGALMLALLFVDNSSSTFLKGAGARSAAQTASLEQWYAHAQVGQILPWTTLKMLRSLPARSLIAADPRMGLAIPMVADQFVLSSGTNFTTDLHYLETVQRIMGDPFDESDIDWESYRERLGTPLVESQRPEILAWERYSQRQRRLIDVGDAAGSRAPIFNTAEPPELTMRLLDALDPDYLLIDVNQHPHLVTLVTTQRSRFGLVAQDGPFQVYRFIESPVALQ